MDVKRVGGFMAAPVGGDRVTSAPLVRNKYAQGRCRSAAARLLCEGAEEARSSGRFGRGGSRAAAERQPSGSVEAAERGADGMARGVAGANRGATRAKDTDVRTRATDVRTDGYGRAY